MFREVLCGDVGLLDARRRAGPMRVKQKKRYIVAGNAKTHLGGSNRVAVVMLHKKK